MNTLFVDLVNWLEYAQDADGRLWLVDYPGGPATRAGPPRELRADEAMLGALVELLQVLSRHAADIHRNAPVAQPHLAAIARLAAALAAGQPTAPSLTEGRRSFDWTPLPGAWGAAVRAAWVNLDEAAATAG